jgi:iron complex outermembrane recepter protein
MKYSSKTKLATSALAVAAFALIHSGASAQDGAAAGADAESEDRGNTIVVTATLRAESLEDVPVSVAAVDADTIAKLGVTDVSDLAVYLPNFEINNSTVLPNLYIRGLGSGATHSIEQSVGRFVDGLYVGRGAMNLHGFFDLEAVELLRGPQGTLFGKNTAAGALIVRTANPTNNFEAGVDLTYGGYSTDGDYAEFQGFVSGPLSDTLRARVAARYRTDDSYYINRLGPENGPAGPDREDKNIRVKLEWDAGPDTVVSAKFEHSEFYFEGSDAAETNAVGGPPGQLAAFLARSPGFNTDLDWVIDTDCTDIISDVNRDGMLDGVPISQGGDNAGSYCPFRDQDMQAASLGIEHDFDGAGTLKILAGYQEYDFNLQFFGIDQGLLNAFRGTRIEAFDAYTLEATFTSDYIADSFDFILGGYYENSSLSRIQFSDVNFVPVALGPIALRRNEPWSQDTETFAIFGQIRYDLTDALRLIAGGRFSTETKDYAFDRFFNVYGTSDIPLPATAPLGPFDPPLSAAADRSESKFTPTATLQYEVSDDLNAYLSFAKGHKTGGFSDRIDVAGADFEFDAEDHTSYEFGLKGNVAGGDLTFNFAAFWVDVEGLQLATQVPGTVPSFSVDNAASVSSRGFEFDATWFVNDLVTVGVDYAYTDATYDDFSGTPSCPASALVNGVCDLSGFPLIFAPKHKGGAHFEFFDKNAFGDWGAGFRIDGTISDSYFTDIAYANSSFEDGYGLVGASIRLVSPDERFTISLVGKNLTEEAILQWGIPTGPNSLASLRAPREIALKVSARF